MSRYQTFSVLLKIFLCYLWIVLSLRPISDLVRRFFFTNFHFNSGFKFYIAINDMMKLFSWVRVIFIMNLCSIIESREIKMNSLISIIKEYTQEAKNEREKEEKKRKSESS